MQTTEGFFPLVIATSYFTLKHIKQQDNCDSRPRVNRNVELRKKRWEGLSRHSVCTESALCRALGVNSITRLSQAAGTDGDFLPCKLEAALGLCLQWTCVPCDGRSDEGGGVLRYFSLKCGGLITCTCPASVHNKQPQAGACSLCLGMHVVSTPGLIFENPNTEDLEPTLQLNTGVYFFTKTGRRSKALHTVV